VTTSTFSALASATARAIAAVRSPHCPALSSALQNRCAPPCAAPSAAASTYSVSSVDGRTTGRCTGAGCITWSEI